MEAASTDVPERSADSGMLLSARRALECAEVLPGIYPTAADAGGFNIEKLIGRTFRPKLTIPYAHSPHTCTFSIRSGLLRTAARKAR